MPYLATADMDAAKIKQEFYRLGCSFDVFNDNENTWISLTGLNDNFEKALALFEKMLEKENIETRPLWKPMHLQPIFESYPYYGNKVAEDLFNRGLCLPSGSNLSPADCARIKKAILSFF
jgi:pentatricopeptide repeat protein